MTKRRVITLVALAIFLGLILLASAARGQDEYGIAEFYRSDCWPRDGLVEHFVLDVGTEGSVLIQDQDEGDFETWTGPEGGCTDCPQGWACTCGAGDIDDETVYIYKTNTSLEFNPGGVFTDYFGHVVSYEANVAYQLTFWARGTVGTEDFGVAAGDPTLAMDTYNFATNTWTAVTTYLTVTDVPTTWTRYVAWINVGAAVKPNYILGLIAIGTQGDEIYIDGIELQKLKAVQVRGSRGNPLTVNATDADFAAGDSDIAFGKSEDLLPRVGTGPAGWWGSQFDGINDFFSCADAVCEMDPMNWTNRGFFSVGCRLMPDTVAAGNDYFISKWVGAGNQRSWFLMRGGTSLAFYVSDDGVNADANTVGMFVVDALHSFVSTFDPSGGSGACENNLYYNAYQIDTDATMTECIPLDSTASFQLGGLESGSGWSGSILECSLWDRELTAIEANKYISPYFPATNHGDGFYVDTCSQAASHAACSIQVCRDGTPNACQAEGTGVMALFGEYTEQLDNNSFEAIVGDPSVGNFSDWTEGGFITAYLADSKHGSVSARMKGGSLSGECIIGGGVDTYFEISAESLVEGGTIEVWLREYDTGFCTNQLAITTIITCTPGSVWDDCGALFAAATWHASTSSYKIQIVDSVNGDMLIDAVSVKEASYRTPWVHCPTGSGTMSYTNRQYELDNPLARFVEAEGKYGYEDGFCASAWVYTDWAGDDGVAHYFLVVPGTAGLNNQWEIVKNAANNIIFTLYDGAGGSRLYYLAINGTAWTAQNWKYIEVCSNNSDNILSARHYNMNNATWYNWATAAGAGTGIQAGQSADIHIGHAINANYLDGYIPEIHLSPYSAIWPQKGWNQGRPPVNHAPY